MVCHSVANFILCKYAECHFDQFNLNECLNAQGQCTECYYAQYHCAEYR